MRPPISKEQIAQELADVDTLFPEGKPVTLGKYTVTLYPMPLRDCVLFLKRLQPVIRRVLSLAPDKTDKEGDETTMEFLRRLRIAIALSISEHDEDFLQALALGMNRDRDYVGRIPPALVIPLLENIFFLNADFFEQSLIGLAATMQATIIQTPSAGLGLTQ